MTRKMIQRIQGFVLQHKTLKYMAVALLLHAVNFPLIRLWYATRLRHLVVQAAPGRAWLHLACGKHLLSEWINIDIISSSPGPEIFRAVKSLSQNPCGADRDPRAGEV